MLVFEAETEQLYGIWIYDGTIFNFMVNDLHLWYFTANFHFHLFVSFYHKSILSLDKYRKKILLAYILSNEVYVCVHT